MAENGAVIPVTVGIPGETIREIALYSGDLTRLAIKAVLAPLASPWASVRVRMRESGNLIVIATTDDGRQLTGRKRVNVTGGAYPKDGPATDPGIKLIGRSDTLKMLMSSPMGNTSHIASLRVTTGGQALVEAETTPWLAQNPYFAFKSVQDVGGKFEVEVSLNSGERFAAQTEQGPVTDPVVSIPQPPTPPPEPVDNRAGTRVDLKDGSVLVGKTAAAKLLFASTFGTMEVDLGEVQSFADEALRLADGTVLKGRFAEGTLNIATSRGDLTIPVQDVQGITRSGGAPTTATAVPPQPGQGVLTGRVMDNFKKPVGNATVRILGSALEARTDSDGRYRLNYVPGQLQVEIQAAGHDPTQFALGLSAPTEYPVEDKVLLRMPPRAGVFYWDAEGWTALNECRLNITNKLDGDIDFVGAKEERYSVTGPATRIAPGTAAMFLNNTASQRDFRILPVKANEQIVTAIQRGGISGMLNSGSLRGITYSKTEQFPGRRLFFGDFAPGVYAIVDYPTERVCYKFQVGPDQLRAQQAVEDEPTKSTTLLVDGKTVSYWPASSESKKEAYFQMESKGYRNTYKLDCAGRRFLWTENVDLSTGSPADSAAGAEWKALNPNSTVSNAVYDAICPELLGETDRPAATTEGPSPVQGTPSVPQARESAKGAGVEQKKSSTPKAKSAEASGAARKQGATSDRPNQAPRDARSSTTRGFTEKQQRAVREFNDM